MSRPTISTPRLLLRRTALRDVSWFRELLIDPEIREKTLQPVVHPTQAWRIAWKQIFIDQGRWIIEERSSGCAVGWIVSGPLEPARFEALGFEIRKQFWNRGYATEALVALVRNAFVSSEDRALSGIVFADNLASQRVFRKAGFEDKGECECGGRDSRMFELTIDQWQARTATSS